MKVSIVGSLRDREVACSASDRQGSNFESCVWKTVSSQSSHHPQEVLLAQFSLYVHKGGLKARFISFVKHFTIDFLSLPTSEKITLTNNPNFTSHLIFPESQESTNTNRKVSLMVMLIYNQFNYGYYSAELQLKSGYYSAQLWLLPSSSLVTNQLNSAYCSAQLCVLYSAQLWPLLN